MIQIFGTKKCSESRKALRFFKERGVKTQFINIHEKHMSPGEFDSVVAAVGLDALLDTEGKFYSSKGYAHMDFDIREEILEHPELLKTPVIREGRKALVGYDETELKNWYRQIRNPVSG